jgi:hypothetical protein
MTVFVLATGFASAGSSAAHAGESLSDRLAERATQPDVVLVPPIGEPSPPMGAFVVPAESGGFDVGPSACSSALTLREVDATETRSELWLVDSGVGARLGLPQFGLSASSGAHSVAGLNYVVQKKLVVSGGLDALEACCLRSPETCTDRYVSEYWVGTGAIHRLTESGGSLKTSLKALDKLGSIDFQNTKGWSMASKWDRPMYFAYRTSEFRARSCSSYMDDLPEQPGRVLFTGVSQRVGSEQQARRDAQADARQQVVRYLGEHLSISGDVATSSAEAVLSGVKDELTCLDDVVTTPEGPSYLARVRMYVDESALTGASAAMKSLTGPK